MSYKAKKNIGLRQNLLAVLERWLSRSMAFKFLVNIHKTPVTDLPSDFHCANSVLVVLPFEMLETALQMDNLLMLITHYTKSGATITLLCEQLVYPLVSGFKDVAIQRYDRDDRSIFNKSWKMLCRSYAKKTDICIVLEKNPDFPVLYLAAKTFAPIKVGYGSGSLWPYINISINSSDPQKRISSQNCFLASTLGAKNKTVRWSTSKSTIEGARHQLKERSIQLSGQLVGLDLYYFSSLFERSWVEELVRRVQKLSDYSFYSFGALNEQIAVPQWISETGVVVVAPLTVPRTAALIATSRFIITGKSPVFGMGSLLSTDIIGIFEQSQQSLYCSDLEMVKAVPYIESPDDKTIDAVILQLNQGKEKKQKAVQNKKKR